MRIRRAAVPHPMVTQRGSIRSFSETGAE